MLRARVAAADVAEGNGVTPARLRVSFPDADSFAPVRVRAVVTGELDLDAGGAGGRSEVEASAVAEAAAPAGEPAVRRRRWPAAAATAGRSSTGRGRGCGRTSPPPSTAWPRRRPRGAHPLSYSGFRSDAEQAALFAAHPDPTWVAPPGHSLHRCATELDLGPETAYGWLAANASRFGFVQRYSWEAWHFGFTAGPAPCSAAGNAGVAGGGAGGRADGALAGAASLPVLRPVPVPRPAPARRDPLERLRRPARRPVDGRVQLQPLRGLAGRGPGHRPVHASTAAAYGLADPFDPVEAIDAQAHLMSDLIRQFGSPQLALAAYNAGPAPVEACHCIPANPETQAYVSRILALLGGAGALVVPSFEVRLVA